MPARPDDLDDGDVLVVEEHRFAVVPEWVIGAELCDGAFRLYVLLLRYGNSSGTRMPSRATLAERLHRSKDSVDRALRELVSQQVVRVQHRRSGSVNLTNRYHVRTSDPRVDRRVAEGGGRTSAATTDRTGGGRISAARGGRNSAARVAADLRPNPKQLTQITPPPPPLPSRRGPAARPREVEAAVLQACGISDVDGLASRCQALRAGIGRSTARWSASCLSVAAQAAVRGRGWPAELVESALLAVAADPDSRSPIRVAEAGPWWDTPPTGVDAGVDPELDELDARLDQVDGRRVLLQAHARRQLTAEGLPLTRATVLRRACQLLEHSALPTIGEPA